ncbi:hypothetical protein [Butyrivibrio sp. FC2001]|uniref:hypothetical protein n=1 Tax=Butyrivibrio sp. FC2001 TaxID=1280671 RepID=UPI0004278998|nr:hypothetical protein [Butyrivibrio sp. FC2001]
MKEDIKENKADIAWDGYLVIGIVISMLLTFLENDKSSILLTVFALIVFALSDVKQNILAMIQGIKKYWMFPLYALVYALYYALVPRDMANVKIAILTFALGLTGYCLAATEKEFWEDAFRQLWIFLLAITILNLAKVVLDKTTGYFTDSAVELGMLIIFTAISLLFVESKVVKAGCGLLSAISVFLMIRRGAISLSLFKGNNGMVSVLMKEALFAVMIILGIRLFLKTGEDLEKRKAILFVVIMAVGMVLCIPYRETLEVLMFSTIGCFLADRRGATL